MTIFNQYLIRNASTAILTFVAILLSSPSMATGPRVTPSLFVSDADKVFAVDLVPFVSGEIEGGGLDMEVINAVFSAAGIENSVTSLPLQKMVRYYLQQEGAIAVVGHYLDFSPKDNKGLIAIPVSAPIRHYFTYRPSQPDGIGWNGKLSSLKGKTYGANRGENTSAYKSAGISIKTGSPRALLKMLAAGEVDFIGIPSMSTEWLIDKHFSGEAGNFAKLEPAAGVLPGFIIFNKKHPDGKTTAERFAKAMDSFIADGSYARVVEKYLGKSDNPSDYMQRFEKLRASHKGK